MNGHADPAEGTLKNPMGRRGLTQAIGKAAPRFLPFPHLFEMSLFLYFKCSLFSPQTNTTRERVFKFRPMLNFIRAMENAKRGNLEEVFILSPRKKWWKRTDGNHSFMDVPERAALVKQTPSCH